jgi:hypothetical protein
VNGGAPPGTTSDEILSNGPDHTHVSKTGLEGNAIFRPHDMRMGPCSTPRAEVDRSAGHCRSSQSAYSDMSAILSSINVNPRHARRPIGLR